MKEWILPTFGALMCWGLWSFIPKITTKYLEPQSAIVYEILGGVLVAAIAVFVLNIRPVIHPQGIALAIITGMLGFLGAFCSLVAKFWQHNLLPHLPIRLIHLIMCSNIKQDYNFTICFGILLN